MPLNLPIQISVHKTAADVNEYLNLHTCTKIYYIYLLCGQLDVGREILYENIYGLIVKGQLFTSKV